MAPRYEELKSLYCGLYHNDMAAFDLLQVAALVGGTEAVEHRAVLVFFGMGHHGLVKIEKHTDLPLLYSFVFRLLLGSHGWHGDHIQVVEKARSPLNCY